MQLKHYRRRDVLWNQLSLNVCKVACLRCCRRTRGLQGSGNVIFEQVVLQVVAVYGGPYPQVAKQDPDDRYYHELEPLYVARGGREVELAPADHNTVNPLGLVPVDGYHGEERG